MLYLAVCPWCPLHHQSRPDTGLAVMGTSHAGTQRGFLSRLSNGTIQEPFLSREPVRQPTVGVVKKMVEHPIFAIYVCGLVFRKWISDRTGRFLAMDRFEQLVFRIMHHFDVLAFIFHWFQVYNDFKFSMKTRFTSMYISSQS